MRLYGRGGWEKTGQDRNNAPWHGEPITNASGVVGRCETDS